MKRFYRFLMPLVTIVALAFPWNSRAQEVVTIGEGTSTSYYVPFNSLYGYSFSEWVYPATSINVAGSITKISFYLGTSSSEAQTNQYTVWMKNVTRSSFSSSSDFEPVTTSDVVFNGTWTIPASYTGWVELELDTPFEYDGSSNLMIAVHEYTSGYSTRNFTYTSVTGCGVQLYSDSYNPDPYNPSSYSGSSTTRAYMPNIQMEIMMGDITCYPVKQLSATDIDPQGCTLTWMDTSNSGASYIIYNMADSSVIDEVTDTFYTLTELSANTLYEFAVRANCGAGDTSGWRRISFRTACSFIDAVPVTEDFESYGSGTTAFPACWYKLGSTADRPYINATTSYGHNNSYGLYFYAANSGYCYGIMPPIDPDLDITTLQVRFWTRQYSTSYNCDFVVGVMTDPTDASTFEAIDTVHPAGTTYEDYEIPFVNYTGTGNYIAFSAIPHSGSTTAIYMMLDDVTIEEIPACPRPTSVVLDSVTPDSVYFHVSDAVNTEWVVVYGPAGFDPDTAVDNVINTTNLALSIGGLTANTPYDIYVKAVCADGETTEGRLLSFRTACSFIDAVPVTEDFEGYGSGTTAFPSCWYKLSSTADRPYINATTSYGHNNTHGLYFYAASGGYCYGIMPPIDPDLDITTLQVSFWTRQYSTSYNCDFVVGVMTDPTDASTFEPIDTVHPAGTNYEQFEVFFTNYTGTGNYIAFSSVQHPGYTSAIYLMLDDVTLEEIPTCPPPYGLSTAASGDTIVVHWNERVSGQDYEVVYGPVGFDPDEETTISVSEDSLLVDGLTMGDALDFYVRTDCGSEYSQWIGPATAVVGLVEYNMTVTGTHTLTGCAFTIYDDGGPNGSYSMDCQSTLYVYPADEEHVISVSGTSYTEGTYDYLRIYEGIGTTGTVIFDDYGVSATQTFGPYISESGPITIVFHSDPSVVYDGFEINTICVPAPACQLPSNVMVNNVTNHEATISWNDNSNYNSMNVYWGTGTTIASATDSAEVSGDNSYTITGLTANTMYHAWIKASCDDGDSRDVEVSFRTDINCFPVTDLSVTPGPVSAMARWTQSRSEWTDLTVEYKEASDTAWTSATTSNNYFPMTGLTPATEYNFRIIATCVEGTSVAATANFRTTNFGCLVADSANLVQDTIGNGTSTSSYFPTYSTYNYTLTQQIYLASDFTAVAGGQIEQIGIQMSAVPVARTIEIYMTNTSATNVSSGFIPIAASDLVWSGSTTGNIAAGWNDITLTTPFNYTGGNILVTFRDMTGSWSSGNYGMVSTVTSGISRYIYEDGSSYSVTAPPSGGTVSSDRLNMYFKGGSCLTASTCAAPIVVANAVSTSAIELNWVPGAAETSWLVYIREMGDTIYTLADTVNATTYTATGLNPGLDYEFKVVAVCEDNTAAGFATAATECAPVTVPYTEDFQNADYGVYSRNCWTVGTIDLGTNYPYPYVISLTGDENNKLCLIYNGGYLIMPEMNAQLNTLQARFTLVQGGNDVRLIIGLMTDPTAPIQNIMVLDTLIRSELDTSSATVNITFPFDMLDDTVTGHITFWDAFNDNYSFIDNLVVEPIPACTAVTGVSASNVTSTDATITWDAAGNSATGYLVEYGPRNFAPGTGTVVNAATNSLTLTGLNHSSDYDAYVYTVCSGLNDTSINSNRVRFTTSCDVATLPYVQNFDNCADPGTTRSPLPNCWNYTMLSTGTYAGASYTPAVYYTTSTGYTSSGDYCLYLYGTALTVLPEMPTTVDSLYITFHHYTSSPSSYRLIIGAVDSVTPGFEASFVGIDTLVFTANENNVLRFLSTYTGTGRYIAFQNIYNNNSYDYSYHYIDDLEVGYMPSCVWPVDVHATGLTTTTAEFAWSICQASDYEYEYGPAGFTRGTGTTGTWNSAPYGISGLTLGTQYDIYVRGICGAGDTSEWSSVYTFGTLNADPATVPFYCDFTDTTLTNAGWEVVNGTQNNKWYVGSAASNGTPNALYVSNDNGTSNAYTVSGISITYAYRDVILADGQYAISYDWKANGESTWDYIRAWLVPASQMPTAGYLPDGTTSTSSFNSSGVAPAGWISIDGGAKLNLATTWQSHEEELNLSAGTYHLLFMWANDASGGSNPPAAIDNVSLALNVCPISNITLDAATGSSMQISWTGNSDGYELEYGPAGFMRGTGVTMNTTSTSANLTGLDAFTTYDIYLRGFCNVTDTSRWYRASFTTAMCDNITMFSLDSATGQYYYTPVNNYYHFTLTETIIDSAELAAAGLSDIGIIGYNYASSTPMSDKTDVTIWLQPTTKTVFSSSSDVVALDTNTAVMVYTGSLNCEQGWNYFAFANTFTWDGHSNLLVIVDDNSDAYDGSSYYFNTVNSTGYKTIHYYSDSYNPDPMSPSSFSGSKAYVQYRAQMSLLSCGAGCAMPTVSVSNIEAQSATVTAVGDGTVFELEYGIDNAALGNTMTSTTGVFNLTGLEPETQYFFAVRQQCDTNLWSNWYNGTFTTDELGCLPPTGLAVTATGYTSASFSWTVGNQETAWEVRVFSNTIDTIVTSTTTSATVNGLQADMPYSAAVRALCGVDANVPGPWSDTVTFTTNACEAVTNVTVAAGSTTATVSWNATGNSYRVIWGEIPFNPQDLEGEATVTTNSYIITGLLEETDYAVVVYNNCAEGLSMASNPVNFTTTSGGVEPTIYTVVVVANNPAWGTVTGSGQYAEGSTVTITATANEGYHFEMWSDGNTEATRSFTITSNVSLTANFAEDGTQTTYYDVTVSSNNEAWGTVTGGGRYAEGSTATIAAVPNTGYRFVEWNDHNTDNPRTITVTADMSFTATFEAVENGIEDVVAGTVSLYPNPASTSVTLGLEGFEGESQVEVVDMNGRVVLRHEVRDAKLEMNVSELPQGAYFVRVTNGTRTAISKLIVK